MRAGAGSAQSTRLLPHANESVPRARDKSGGSRKEKTMKSETKTRSKSKTNTKPKGATKVDKARLKLVETEQKQQQDEQQPNSLTEKIGEWSISPVASAFPFMSPEEFEALKTDISTRGQQKKITCRDDLVLDGRNRLKACVELGIEPQFESFEGTEEEAVALVLGENMARRHMNESQRACTAASLHKGKIFPNLKVAAEALRVSDMMIKGVRRVRKNGHPKLYEAVRSGALRVTAATELLALTGEHQAQMADELTHASPKGRTVVLRSWKKQAEMAKEQTKQAKAQAKAEAEAQAEAEAEAADEQNDLDRTEDATSDPDGGNKTTGDDDEAQDEAPDLPDDADVDGGEKDSTRDEAEQEAEEDSSEGQDGTDSEEQDEATEDLITLEAVLSDLPAAVAKHRKTPNEENRASLVAGLRTARDLIDACIDALTPANDPNTSTGDE